MTWYFRASSRLNIVQYFKAWDVVFRNLGKGKDANSRIATLIIKRKNFELFGNLLGRGLWDKLLEVSPRELTNFKGWPPLSLRMNNSETHKTTERHQEACMDEGAPDKTLKWYLSGRRVRSVIKGSVKIVTSKIWYAFTKIPQHSYRAMTLHLLIFSACAFFLFSLLCCALIP